jgi:hypothetical protein
MTLIDAINRILRKNAVIRGDTDLVSTLADTQHNASLNLAVVAIQDELVKLIAERLIPSERKTTGSITFATQTRTYALATDFIRFFGVPHFYRATENREIFEYDGGLEALQVTYFNYATNYGNPVAFYWEPASTKQVGFFQVPSLSENGNVWTYEYEGSVMVSVASDTLPFHNDEENYSFIEMCSRRFKYAFEDVKNQVDITAVLEKDRSYTTAYATLLKLIKGQNPSRSYGAVYR